MGEKKGEEFADLVALLGSTVVKPGPMDAPPPPEWAAHLQDLRHLLRFDATQYVVPLGINGRLVLAIVDTGAHRTVICTAMAEALGLQVK